MSTHSMDPEGGFVPMSPSYAFMSIVKISLLMLALTIVALAVLFLNDIEFPARFLLTLVGAAVIWGGGVAWASASARRMGYAVRENDIHYRHGLFWRQVVAIPYNRIQHADIRHGPFERTFGLAKLAIYTAGADQASMVIKGLEIGVAVPLLHDLLKLAGADDARDD